MNPLEEFYTTDGERLVSPRRNDSLAAPQETQLALLWRSLHTEARQRPWLRRLLAERGAQLLEAFAKSCQALLSLSRQQRRALLRRAGTGLAGTALLLALGSGSAFANTITVDGTTCTLIEAIQNANDTTTGDLGNGCAAGNPSGADTIDLQASVSLNTSYANGIDGPTSLPAITSAITIQGNGNIIGRDTSGPAVRLFLVATTGDLTLNQSTVTYGASQTGAGGGGIRNRGSLTLNQSTISSNGATDTYGYGGGIFNLGTLVMNNSTVKSNNATAQGGGIYNAGSGTATLNNSTVSNNTADSNGKGGGITSGGSLTLNTSTISGNSATGGAGIGGGIYNNGTAVINNSTIAANYAYASGGGIHVKAGDTLTLNHSLLVSNFSTDLVSSNVENLGTVNSTQNFNLFGHLNTAYVTGFTATDIGAVPSEPYADIISAIVGSYGGPTYTHSLPSGSPAIDAIPTGSLRSGAAQPATCTASASYDQRGFFRANGGTTGSACDIGAFEYGATPTAVTIASFSSQTAWGSGPQLNWETSGESGLSGFHIWRGSAAKAESRLTDALIGAAGGLNGHEYSWQDAVSFGWGQRTHYWLEAVTADGSNFTGPVEVVGIGRLFLPSVAR